MILQAFADDSGSDTRSSVFALGGLVAPLKKWEGFPDEWAAALRERDQPHRLRYFKTSEAASFHDEFQDWNTEDRDARVARLAKIIPDYASYQFGISLRRSDYVEIIVGDMLPEYKDPYFLLALGMVVSGHRILLDLFPKANKIDFVFDRQGKLGPAFKGFFDRVLAPRLPHLGECLHVSSKTFLPLQAADMIASRTRTDADHVAVWSAAHVFLDRVPQIPPLHLTRSHFAKMLAASALARDLNSKRGSPK